MSFERIDVFCNLTAVWISESIAEDDILVTFRVTVFFCFKDQTRDLKELPKLTLTVGNTMLLTKARRTLCSKSKTV